MFLAFCYEIPGFLLLFMTVVILGWIGVETDLSTALTRENRGYYRSKVVVITGASAGIGEAFARYVSSCGATVVLVARRENELKRVQVLCKKDGANIVHTIAFDMSKIDKIPTLVETIYNLCGRVDILLNNAGRTQRCLAVETSCEDTKTLFDLNTLSVIELTRLVVGRMEMQTPWFNDTTTRGHVAVTSSVSGKIGTPGSSTYSACKAALHGYYNALRSECAQNGIRTSVVCPGPVDTDIAINAVRGEGVMDSEKADRGRMDVRKCAEYMGRGLSANLKEIWIANWTVLLFTYGCVYFPVFSALLAEKLIGPARVRDLKSGKTGYEGVYKSFFTFSNKDPAALNNTFEKK